MRGLPVRTELRETGASDCPAIACAGQLDSRGEGHPSTRHEEADSSAWPQLPRVGLLVLVTVSAITITVATVNGITVTGDRLLGLGAVGAALLLARSARLRWTPIHAMLAIFLTIQLVCSLLNARLWPQGMRLATIYVLGFACFVLTDAWVMARESQRWMVSVWIAVGAGVGLLAAAAATASNLLQVPLWGAAVAEIFTSAEGVPLLLFAGRALFSEQNLMCGFLLIPFSLALWRWAPRGEWDRQTWIGFGWLSAIVLGLVFSVTRAGWISMAAIVAFWWWFRRPAAGRLGAVVVVIATTFVGQAAVIKASNNLHLSGAAASQRRVTADKRPAIADANPRVTLWRRVMGWSPLMIRVIEPAIAGYDTSMEGRAAISRATLRSWLDQPLLGHGAGSTNRLWVNLPDGRRFTKVWNGNVSLHILHDSGVVGLGALIALVSLVGWRGWVAVRSRRDDAMASVTMPLLVTGGTLLFAYQFTHALWLMYPYVYLGLLTALVAPRDPHPAS